MDVDRIVEHLPNGDDSHVIQLSLAEDQLRDFLRDLARVLGPYSAPLARAGRNLAQGKRTRWLAEDELAGLLALVRSDLLRITSWTLDAGRAEALADRLSAAAEHPGECPRCGRLRDVDGPVCGACDDATESRQR
jgi:plasmid stabilization system protein ParE